MRIAAKCLEAKDEKHGVHWLPRQRVNINREQKQNDEAIHQDPEPFIDTLVQMRVQLRELEPSRSSMVPRF